MNVERSVLLLQARQANYGASHCERRSRDQTASVWIQVAQETGYIFRIPVPSYLFDTATCFILSDANSFHTYEGESNENLKYVLSRNLLNTKGTQ